MTRPSPELRKLDYFVGVWHSEGELKPGPLGPGGKLIMTEHNEWMDGGFFLVLRSEFTSPLGSGSGTAYMGYDAGRKLYTYDEFNSTGEAQHSVGTFDGDSLMWGGEQHLADKVAKTRFVMNMLSPDAYAFSFCVSQDGNDWNTVMEGKATRLITSG